MQINLLIYVKLFDLILSIELPGFRFAYICHVQKMWMCGVAMHDDSSLPKPNQCAHGHQPKGTAVLQKWYWLGVSGTPGLG